MSSGEVVPVFDTVRKMLQNGTNQEDILKFMDTMYPQITKSLLHLDIQLCTKCHISKCNRTFPSGAIHSEIMIVGEAPGEQEEKQGEPFVGPAGQILTNLLNAASQKIHPRWNRDNIYISNTIKCRPTDGNANRVPKLEEIAACNSFLQKEIALVNPKIIICAGNVSARTLIHPKFKITDEHGKLFGDKIKMMAIYHPSFILRMGEDSDEGVKHKLQVWFDIVKANEFLDSVSDDEH